jgi:peptidoglycan hydrolase CwlO-like protein
MYDTPDWIQIVQDAAIVLAFLSALIAALVAVGKFLIVKPLERYIDQRMPKNGGKSLSELHDKVDGIVNRISRMEKEIVRIDEEIEHLAD